MKRIAHGPIAFSPSFISWSYGDILKRRAVIYPLGLTASSDAAVASAVDAIQAMWRGVTRRLEIHDWDRFSVRTSLLKRNGREKVAYPVKWAMINCGPAFYVPTVKSDHCRQSTICPHCWARNALVVWQKADSAIFGTDHSRKATPKDARPFTPIQYLADDEAEELQDARPAKRSAACPHAIIERTIRYYLDFEDGPELRDFIDARTKRCKRTRSAPVSRPLDFERLRNIGVIGGMESLQVDTHSPDGSTSATGWLLASRQMLVVRHADVDRITRNSTFLSGDGGEHQVRQARVKVHVDATRRTVMECTARVHRYPAMLLKGGARHVIDAVASREGRRLSATFGILHGTNEGGEDG